MLYIYIIFFREKIGKEKKRVESIPTFVSKKNSKKGPEIGRQWGITVAGAGHGAMPGTCHAPESSPWSSPSPYSSNLRRRRIDDRPDRPDRRRRRCTCLSYIYNSGGSGCSRGRALISRCLACSACFPLVSLPPAALLSLFVSCISLCIRHLRYG